MKNCSECEFFRKEADGEIGFGCDPFSNIIEPECLLKWQLLKINQMVSSYQATLDYHQKLAPMQEKMFKFMEREIEDISEADKWRIDDDDDEDDDGYIEEDSAEGWPKDPNA